MLPFNLALLIQICQRNGVTTAWIFGSMTRGNWREDSDIDLLVEFALDSRIGLFQMARLKRELTEAIGRRVDVATMAMIDPGMKDQIISERVQIMPPFQSDD